MATRKNLPAAVSSNTELDFQGMLDEGDWQDSSEVLVSDGQQIAKEDLEGTSFFLTGWTFRNGTQGEYAFVKVMTPAGPGWFTDGSSGVKRQLESISEKMHPGFGIDFDTPYLPDKAIYFEKGLRASHYTYTDDKGKSGEATTYYLNA